MQYCLLDKNVVRKAIEGIGKTQFDLPLTAEERLSLQLLLATQKSELQLYISVEMEHILARYAVHPDVVLFQQFVQTLQPTRYFKRWTRRVREHNFSREDAKVLALATFGTDPASLRFGVDLIVTFDQPFHRNFARERILLEHRLQMMIGQLPHPYATAALPDVKTPGDVLLFGN